MGLRLLRYHNCPRFPLAALLLAVLVCPSHLVRGCFDLLGYKVCEGHNPCRYKDKLGCEPYDSLMDCLCETHTMKHFCWYINLHEESCQHLSRMRGCILSHTTPERLRALDRCNLSNMDIKTDWVSRMEQRLRVGLLKVALAAQGCGDHDFGEDYWDLFKWTRKRIHTMRGKLLKREKEAGCSVSSSSVSPRPGGKVVTMYFVVGKEQEEEREERELKKLRDKVKASKAFLEL